LVVCLFVVLSSSISARQQFIEFQQKYGKVYNDQDEFEIRFSIFQDNIHKAMDLQKLNPMATFGVTKFSDLSTREFASKYLMSNVNFKNNYISPPSKNFDSSDEPDHPPSASCIPNKNSYDWSTCGCTTPIYNQGQCGSVWAFSTVETIESYYFLNGHPLTALSTEQIVDCDTAGEDEGCNGGDPQGAFLYVVQAGGLEPLVDYPYTAGEGESGNCTFELSKVVAKATSYKSIKGEKSLYQQLSIATGGPVGVCVDASTWQSYQSGILTNCGDTIDFCAQLVGYHGYPNSGPNGTYWIVRNDWGEDWGINGFIWIAIGQDLCGIGDYAYIITTN